MTDPKSTTYPPGTVVRATVRVLPVLDLPESDLRAFVDHRSPLVADILAAAIEAALPKPKPTAAQVLDEHVRYAYDSGVCGESLLEALADAGFTVTRADGAGA